MDPTLVHPQHSDVALSVAGPSPFLTDNADFGSPSLSSGQLNHSPNSPFDDAFDVLPASPRIAHTPSYAGSYQGSPYTTYSDLSYSGGDIGPLGLFDDAVRAAADDYDPMQYDVPAQNSLLVFQQEYMGDGPNSQIALTMVPQADGAYDSVGSPYNHSSPGSSNGAGADNVSLGSRRSSVASLNAPGAPGSFGSPDMSHRFQSLAVDANGALLSPTEKPQSPPRLIINETSPSGANFPSPVVRAPDTDSLGGPALCFVPATPVSGGGAAAPAVPFQPPLDGLHHAPGPAQPAWNAPSLDARAEMFKFPPPTQSPNPPPHMLPQSDYQPSGLARTRRVTDGVVSGHTPQLYTMPPEDDSALLEDPYTLSAMTPGSSPGSVSSFHTAASGMRGHALAPHPARPPHLSHNYTYGPPSSTNAHLAPAGFGGSPGMSSHLGGSPGMSPHLGSPGMSPHLGSPGMSPHLGGLPLAPGLSPQMSTGALPGPGAFLSPADVPSSLRRARSDGGRSAGHRYTRSEDFVPAGTPDYGAQQFLAPDAGLEPAGARGMHHRRASSGSRVAREHFIGGPASTYGGSARSSPYPSPSVSPRGGGYDMPLPDVHLAGNRRQDAEAHAGGAAEPVVKQNVTTHATKQASQGRRKVDASFQCPVPGCGSTFTRHFNLKGHLRSHNEEKPYECKWPGCKKSFARQHDCKRHENLHLNIRPFVCDGCKKTFARMDALNRHLRSEGGIECQKVQAVLPPASVDEHGQPVPVDPYSAMKAEPDGSWAAGGLMM